MVIEIESSDCPDEDKLRKSLFSLEHRTQGGLRKDYPLAKLLYSRLYPYCICSVEIEELCHILQNRGEVISQSDIDLMLRDIQTNIENEASIEGDTMTHRL